MKNFISLMALLCLFFQTNSVAAQMRVNRNIATKVSQMISTNNKAFKKEASLFFALDGRSKAYYLETATAFLTDEKYLTAVEADAIVSAQRHFNEGKPLDMLKVYQNLGRQRNSSGLGREIAAGLDGYARHLGFSDMSAMIVDMEEFMNEFPTRDLLEDFNNGIPDRNSTFFVGPPDLLAIQKASQPQSTSNTANDALWSFAGIQYQVSYGLTSAALQLIMSGDVDLKGNYNKGAQIGQEVVDDVKALYGFDEEETPPATTDDGFMTIPCEEDEDCFPLGRLNF